MLPIPEVVDVSEPAQKSPTQHRFMSARKRSQSVLITNSLESPQLTKSRSKALSNNSPLHNIKIQRRSSIDSKSNGKRSAAHSSIFSISQAKLKVQSLKSKINQNHNAKKPIIKKKVKVPAQTTIAEDHSRISYDHLYQCIYKAINIEYRRLFTPTMFKKCYTWAKLSTPLVSPQLLLSSQ